jgi:hypothetical protein
MKKVFWNVILFLLVMYCALINKTNILIYFDIPVLLPILIVDIIFWFIVGKETYLKYNVLETFCVGLIVSGLLLYSQRCNIGMSDEVLISGMTYSALPIVYAGWFNLLKIVMVDKK